MKVGVKVKPEVRGKFIFLGEDKLYLKGVTYGTFAPNGSGESYPAPDVVAQDFAQMAANGINAVRTYTAPPTWLLDLAYKSNIWVMVGLPWEQHIAFLEDKNRIQDIIENRILAGVRACAGHPSVLCYAVGNEIPAPIARWYGNSRIESFLERLYHSVKTEDSESLVTYVNYPSTEYLQIPFVDFVCFNVYLESKADLEAYLARLQNLAGNLPLVMAEIGLDSQRNGEAVQAQTLEWQIRTIFAAGCAGCFLFAWTDEWYRGGAEIEDWDFGLTDRKRQPKLALDAVRQTFAEVPFPENLSWPHVSVVVCSYNGSKTIRDTLEGLQKLDYPDYEVIVVDDGSTDEVTAIASEYDVRVITHSQNQGLSAARNTGMEAGMGEIIAYIDDDAYPDPHWLTYLVATFLNSEYAGVGGPNLPPPDDGLIADCVANAPGGPMHVLLSDREAEHIPGCNMAYWKTYLQEIGGFDPQFRAAGDDVDVCWRLQDRSWKLGFSPAAVVWHHRRNSVKMYWKQQKGYGKAEALLESKWPQKYNALGHLSWSGRLYGQGIVEMLDWSPSRIYYGTWGSALFQSVYQPGAKTLSALPSMPEWYLVILVFAGLSSLAFFWKPLIVFIPCLFIASIALVAQAVLSASNADFSSPLESKSDRFKLHSLTALLYLLQPLARLWGRIDNGLTPWRRRGAKFLKFPIPQQDTIWSEFWHPPEKRLSVLKDSLYQQGAIAMSGSDFDRWDLEIRGGLFGAVRVLMVVEEHGQGKQLVRFGSWPKINVSLLIVTLVLATLSIVAAFDRATVVSGILGAVAGLLVLFALQDCATANASYFHALERVKVEKP